MTKDILMDVGSDQIRMAVIEDSQVAEVRIEKTKDQSLVGNIYRGKVEHVFSGMQSAFVEIGLEKNAYLYVKDVIPENFNEDGDLNRSDELPDISYFLSTGQEVTVQIIKDAVGEKGPRVTTHISLPGRFMVLKPQNDFIGISKKINNLDERLRLKKIAASLKPDRCGLIVRTAAENVHDDLLTEDIKGLLELWGYIQEREQKGKVPRTLYTETGIIGLAIREYLSPEVNRFLVNDKEAFEKIISILNNDAPELKAKVQYYFKDYDMFEFYDVQRAINEAISRKVWLKSGAYLIFDYTEALTVIDVNSGKFIGKTNLEETAFKINLEAAKAIARQIRIRNLSGIIIVDFIDMHKKEHREELIQTLKDAVKADKTQTVVVGMTSLGLVEITRKKVRLPLSAYFTKQHPV